MPGFRVNRAKFGLTYSCPVTASVNPITSAVDLLKFLTDKFGTSDYIIGTELHQNGKNHYHCYMKFHTKVDSTNCKLFDFKGVHPNIITPGKGWIDYCAKAGEYITNFYERDPYATALRQDNLQEAISYLWQKRPKDMCHSAHNIEDNLRKKFKNTQPQLRYAGPFPEKFYPPDYNRSTHSLLLVGPPGIGKTQFARYLLGDCDYVKSKLEALRACQFDKPILFDEICMLGTDKKPIDPEESKEITDVENGGTLSARYRDINIPPGVTRIFCSNMEYPFRNPNEAVYGRRVVSHVIT